MNNDWRIFRPAIWLAMVGIAALLVVNALVGAALIGGAIGVALRIQGRRRAARRSRGQRSEPVARRRR